MGHHGRRPRLGTILVAWDLFATDGAYGYVYSTNGRDIEVDDAELQRAIQSQEAFQSEGAFNKDVYLRVLELNRVTPQPAPRSRQCASMRRTSVSD